VTPDLRPYTTLLVALLSRRLTPTEFQAIFVPLFKKDTVWRPQEIYEVLNDIFLAAEALKPDASPADPFAVTEEQLYQVAQQGLRRLEEVVDPG
jgi:self-protective colicin-like immunity protein